MCGINKGENPNSKYNMKINFGGRLYTIHYLPVSKYNQIWKILNKDSMLFGIDIETYALDSYKDHPKNKKAVNPYLTAIRLIQIYDGSDNVLIFDCKDLVMSYTTKLLNKLKHKKLIAHYAAFELAHLSRRASYPLEIACSQQLGSLVDRAEKAEYGENPGALARRTSLKALTKKYLGLDISKTEQKSDWGVDSLSAKQLAYAAVDAICTRKLGAKLIKKIRKYKMLDAYYQAKSMQHVVTDMSLNGMLPDNAVHDDLIASWEKKKAKAHIMCRKHFGDINLNSNPQLCKWGEENLGELLENWPRTPAGNLSFSQDQISEYMSNPGIKALVEYRKQSKLLSTYGMKLRKEQLIPATGRYHSTFTIVHTKTGRLSSREPNLQNIPRDSDIRAMFIAPKGYQLVVADYAQIELRIAGELSQDPTILSAYENGEDLHRDMAAEALGIKPIDVTKEERQDIGKGSNFGFLYGMGAAKFQSQVQKAGRTITMRQAEAAHTAFYNRYSVYIDWSNEQRSKAKKLGYCRTPLGRMRKLRSDDVFTKAVNTPVQGGAAEIIMEALLALRVQLKGKGKLINCVHDEIIVECPVEHVEAVKTTVEHCMVLGFKKLFPKGCIKDLVEAHSGNNWMEAKG